MGKKDKKVSKVGGGRNGKTTISRTDGNEELFEQECNHKYNRKVDGSVSRKENQSELKRKSKNRNSKKSNHSQNYHDELRHAIEMDGTKSVIEMASDGNCLFRSLSDQLYDDYGSNHFKVRNDVVDYMEGHENDFSVFLVFEDDKSTDNGHNDGASFSAYCNDMRNDGTWGGNLELVAASKMYRRNITVYSTNLSAFTINHESGEMSTGPDLLISYHDDHYNSVRHNNSVKKPLPIKTYNKSGATNHDYTHTVYSDTESDIIIHISPHQEDHDDDVSTTDTDSSKQSSKTSSTIMTDDGNNTVTTATSDATPLSFSSSRSSQSENSIRTTLTSTSTTTTTTTAVASVNTSITDKTDITNCSLALKASSSSNDNFDADSDELLKQRKQLKARPVQRKAPCPCGSEIKYYKCCGNKGYSNKKPILTGSLTRNFIQTIRMGDNRYEQVNDEYDADNDRNSDEKKNTTEYTRTKDNRQILKNEDNDSTDPITEGHFRILKI